MKISLNFSKNVIWQLVSREVIGQKLDIVFRVSVDTFVISNCSFVSKLCLPFPKKTTHVIRIAHAEGEYVSSTLWVVIFFFAGNM